MLASRFVLGQRWLSQTEPELGLGLALKLETDRITIVFPSSDTTRVYTVENPPLTRVIFTVGDVLKTQDGKPFIVESVSEKDGRVIYHTKGKKVDESELADSLTFSKPIDRLMNAQVDDKALYNLRHRALYRRFKTLRAPLRGLLGGLFTPRHHQMHTAVQATRLPSPRILIADEPGMGKMIQAGLILQRLKIFDCADRVLLIAPEAQIDTAETDLERRFGYEFHRVTADGEAAAKPKKATKKAAKSEESGPFGAADEPGWMSITLEELTGHRAKMSKLAAAAGWNAVVVAGAEELKWTDAGGSAEWSAVEPVAAATASLLLLSDDGPQHDEKSHFGRLHLLDAETYSSTRKVSRMRTEQEPVEKAILKLLDTTTADKESEAVIKPLAAEDARVKELMKFWKEGREDVREQIIDHLLDGQDTGRSVFVNTRKNVPGLPTREVKIIPLENATPEIREGLKEEYKLHGKKPEEPAKGKPKAEPGAADGITAVWLATVANPAPPAPPAPPGSGTGEPPAPPAPPPRILIICATRGRAAAVEKLLRSKVQGRVELLTGEKRFEIEDTPRVVVGSYGDITGRNFPGIEALVFWDAPLTLEEAQAPVFAMENSCTLPGFRVLLPVIADTPQEMFVQWLHEGLHAFTEAAGTQPALRDEFQKPVHDVAKRIGVKHNPALHEELAGIIKKSAAAAESAHKKLDKHRDIFLERVSCRIPGANQAHHRISATDEDESLDMQNNRTLEQCGILVETKGPRMVFVRPNPEATFRLDLVPKDGMTLTYSRTHAAIREDAHFLTWDADVVASASERMLATAVGNTAYVVWEDERAQLLLLEGIYLASPKEGDRSLQVSRHMPPTPVRVVISHELEDMSGEYTSEVVNKMVRNGRREWIRNNARPLHNLIPSMLRNLNGRAELKMRELAAKATHQMETSISTDIARIRRLPESKARNAGIKALEDQIAALKPLLGAPDLKLDQLRLIRRGPSGKGI